MKTRMLTEKMFVFFNFFELLMQTPCCIIYKKLQRPCISTFTLYLQKLQEFQRRYISAFTLHCKAKAFGSCRSLQRGLAIDFDPDFNELAVFLLMKKNPHP